MSWAEYRQHLEKLSKLCGIAFYEDDDVFFLMMMMMMKVIPSPFFFLRVFLKDGVSPTENNNSFKASAESKSQLC